MPVSALFNKRRVLAQVLHGLMLDDQQAISSQKIFVEYDPGYFGDLIQVIRRVGKYQVELIGFVL